jgi:2-C-methyl-D-erythritol 2,4-cyclodiphosphate synthase
MSKRSRRTSSTKPARRQSPSVRKPRKLTVKARVKAGPVGAPAFRVGHGYDLHRLERVAPEGAGRVMILGGVKIPESAIGPVGHSDGDVLYHAVTDAILGALGLPDIGQLFPDTDPKHDGQDSAVFLREANKRMRAMGYRVSNMDVTVICERPKVMPIKEKIRANVARLIGADVSLVNIKGKTHEKVDAVGEGRAIECHVVVLLIKA